MLSSTYCRLAATGLLITFLASCSKEKLDVTPQPRALATNGTGTFSYQQYKTLPEAVSDVAGTGTDIYAPSGPPVYKLSYVLGRSQIRGGHPIYVYDPQPDTYNYPFYYTQTDGKWYQSSGPNGGGAIRLVASFNFSTSTTRVFAITDQNQLWTYDANYNWYYTGFLAADVAVLNNSEVYFLGAANVYGGHKIYHLTGNTAVEVLPGSAAVSIAVDSQNRLWAVNSLDQIFVNANPLSGGYFAQVPGAGKQVACDNSSIALIGNRYLNQGYEMFRRANTDPINQNTWQLQGGDATRIIGSTTGGYVLTNNLGEAFFTF